MKILIELPSWLGDTVMATPAIENLIKFHKESEFSIIGPKNSIEIFKHHPKIYKSYKVEKRYFSLFLLTRKIGKFDLFFSFRSSIRSKILTFFVNSTFKYGYKKENINNIHQVEKYNQFINKSLNLETHAGSLTIYKDGQLESLLHTSRRKKPMLGINPGATYGNAKRWYPEEFANVAANLSNKYDITILGGVNERKIAKDIQNNLEKKGVNNFENVAGKLDISELIDYISNFDILITGDSGPMHIAACYEVPTVSIFGPTREKETSQWMNPKSIVLKKNLACQPCMKRKCPLQHHNCMKQITSKDVLKEIKSLNL